MSGEPGRCPGCGAELAPSDEAVEVDGATHHRATNRAGVEFRVACYGVAPGCAAAGPATDEDTWFPGHTWQRAFCRACGVHAGWLFRGKTRVFTAIIRGRAAGPPEAAG